MDCRGNEKRKRIVEHYNVVPVAHLPLLHGQTKRSDARHVIEREYYIFEVRNKDDDSIIDLIQCGMGAARDFLELLKHPGVSLFNPLEGEGGGPGGCGGSGATSEWHPAAKQLYNAIMWLITIWDATPNTPLFKFRDDILKNKKYRPYPYYVKRVNSTIENGGKGKTLTEMINGVKVHNDIRDGVCRFNLLEELLVEYTDKDGNRVELKSFF